MYVLSVVISAQSPPARSSPSSPFTPMSAVTAIPVPKSDKELKVFYYRKWQDSKDIIETKIARIEQLVTQKADDLKAIKYLL